MIAKQASKLPNWKAPGPDGHQGFWLKHVRSVRVILAELFNECINQSNVPKWLTKGVTTLVLKNKDKGNAVTNFRPITCLPLMWKMLTGIIAEEMYKHMAMKKLIPDEQKGCRKESRGSDFRFCEIVRVDKLVLQWHGLITRRLMI